ncbi:MAG: hypothetical protein GQ553_01835 [Nitrosomonadaceae bacterium]|nr:hypothetical protein [Nitrosomonadaceae bacterium]
MTQSEFEGALQDAVDDYNASTQDQEAKQTYLDAISSATKSFTSIAMVNCTTWPC